MVINPKQQADHYPFRDFAGVGLAFKLAQALLLAEQREPILPAPPALEERDLLDLVALGTVADLAPLLGENRSLVQRGLAELNKPRRPGIQAMLEEAKVSPGKVDATAIGFVLGPRINAAGRLKHANLSYDLLTAPDSLTARPLAEELAALNRERQNLTLAKVELAQQQIAADRDGRGERGDRYLYLVAHPDFESGIVGLVAGRLVEDLYRPVLVAKVGDEETHGSARSISEFNITAALDECRELLVRHGGHAAAAGFAVKNENLETLRARLEAIAERELGGARPHAIIIRGCRSGVGRSGLGAGGTIAPVGAVRLRQPAAGFRQPGPRSPLGAAGRLGWQAPETGRARSQDAHRHGRHRVSDGRVVRPSAQPGRPGVRGGDQRVQRAPIVAVEREGYAGGVIRGA